MENQETFSYTYNAKDRAEIEKIRNKYLPREQDTLGRLRALDAAVTQKASVWSLVLGIVGALILGVGMCCTMVWDDKWFAAGIIIGIVGIVMTALAYPLYQRVLKKEREKIAPEILRLSQELMK